MSLFLHSQPSLLFPNPNSLQSKNKNQNRILPSIIFNNNKIIKRILSFPTLSSFSQQNPESEIPPIPIPIPIPISSRKSDNSDPNPLSRPQPQDPPRILDEWGEEADLEEDVTSATKLPDADPPKGEDEDEWGKEPQNGNDVAVPIDGDGDDANDDGGGFGDLKLCLVDSVYGTNFGFQASSETRAEVVEIISQLEAANPTPAPTQEASILNGNWVLLYTAFSELLPLIAVGSLPLLKIEKISQEIDIGSSTIQNIVTFSSPLVSFSFSASASFEVRSPSRIQVKFKEGIFQPPEISSSVDLPQSVDVFGQKVDLLPLQRSLNPLQEIVANIARAISGQPPLKVPIPGERTQSWLVTTFLDQDLRISRGDGGLFVLVKEGSELLSNFV